MKRPTRVGVLTGGGDVPGLNVVIKTLANCLERAEVETIGLRRGWASLLALAEGSDAPAADWTVRLDRDFVRTIDRSGGTILHSSRTNPAATKPSDVPKHLLAGAPAPGASGRIDLTKAAVRTLERLKLEALVAIGGDDTLSFGKRLHQEGVPVIGIPKTMDNDVPGTDYCIGFGTACARSTDLITALRTPTGSHERFLVVELFGRNSGATALTTALLCGADRALIPEVPFELGLVAEKLLADRSRNPSRYAVLLVSEGAFPKSGEVFERGEADAFGHRKLGGVGQAVGDQLQALTKVGIVAQNLAYLMRSGPPDLLDRMVAMNYARNAAAELLAGRSGGLMALVEGRYRVQSLDLVGGKPREVDVDRFYDRAEYRPKLDGVIDLPMFLR